MFELAQRDPYAALRASHYRWLVARDWNVQAVYRAACSDPDPSIAAWAAAHAVPSDGAFR